MGLDRMPVEILLKIASHLDSEKDLAALVLSYRGAYVALNGVLYERNVFDAHPKDSCVLWAARKGSLNTIKLAYAHGANLNLYDPQSELRTTIVWSRRKMLDENKIFSPLHVSVMKGFHDITRYLLEHGASVDIPSIGLCICHATYFRPLFPSWYPLHIALAHGKEGEISARILIEHGARKEAAACPGLNFRTISYQPSLAMLVAELGGLRPTLINAEGLGPLHLASQAGMDDVLAIILADPSTDITAKGLEDNTSVLHHSVAQRNINTTRRLLQMPGIEVETVDNLNRNVVFAAARGCNDGTVASVIALLVARGANINLPDHGGVTPLYAAASRRAPYDYPNFMAVNALLDHRACPFVCEQNDDHWTIFHQLLRRAPNIGEVIRPRQAALRKLIALGVDFNTHTCTRNELSLVYDSDATPLFFAATQALDAECLRILLEAGARPNMTVSNRADPDEFKEESFLGAFFRHIWQSPGREVAPPLSQVGNIIVLLLRYGARLEQLNNEESPLEFLCRRPDQRFDYSRLDFVLQHATKENVSLEHLEVTISVNMFLSARAVGMAADHYDIVVDRLQKFKEREFPQAIEFSRDFILKNIFTDIKVDFMDLNEDLCLIDEGRCTHYYLRY